MLITTMLMVFSDSVWLMEFNTSVILVKRKHLRDMPCFCRNIGAERAIFGTNEEIWERASSDVEIYMVGEEIGIGSRQCGLRIRVIPVNTILLLPRDRCSEWTKNRDGEAKVDLFWSSISIDETGRGANHFMEATNKCTTVFCINPLVLQWICAFSIP